MNPTLIKCLIPNLLLLALAGFAYFKAGQFDTGTEGGFVGPDLWPRIICVVLALTSAIGIIAALVSVEAQTSEEDEALESMLAVPETHPRLVWIAVAATGLYVAALTSIGYLCATMLYAMALLVIGGMRRWAMVPIYGAILAIVFTIIFMKIVYVALPLGEGMFKSVSLFAMQLLGIH
jgi:putative tricarboxylic transport membrane protein